MPFPLLRCVYSVALWRCLSFCLPGKEDARHRCKKDPVAMAALFTYACCFSFAYLELPTGTGALILFCLVQLTMMTVGILKGSRPSALAWSGIIMALGGMVYLLLPGVSMPSWHGALLMGISGMACGIYSIRGGRALDPVANTAWNFIGSAPLALICMAFFWPDINLTPKGVLLSIGSGAAASALSYVIWYTVLPRVKTSVAATVQISVPLLAAIGGVILMGEQISVRLFVAGRHTGGHRSGHPRKGQPAETAIDALTTSPGQFNPSA